MLSQAKGRKDIKMGEAKRPGPIEPLYHEIAEVSQSGAN
jgi:hypothetical protein